MNKLLYLAAFSAVLTLNASIPPNYTTLQQDGPAINALKNSELNESTEHWQIEREFEYGQYGQNQSGGLRLRRTNPQFFTVASQQVKLKPNTTYTLSGWLATDQVKGAGASLCIEWYEKGKYVGGYYLPTVTGTSEWTERRKEFSTSAKPEFTYRVALYLKQGSTGTAAFDRVTLLEKKPFWNLAMIEPKFNSLNAGDGRAELASAVIGEFRYQRKNTPAIACSYTLSNSSGIAVRQGVVPMKDVNGRAMLTLGANPPGGYTLKCALLDRANRLVLGSRELPVQIVDDRQLEARRSKIDGHGRLLINGKPFMPLGFFFGGITPERVRELAGTPFNTIMSYSSPFLSMDDKPASRSKKSVREVLDLLEKNNLKLIFSLQNAFPGKSLSKWYDAEGYDQAVAAIVREYKKHPAILAWLLSDEMPSSRLEELLARRRQLNHLDPDHPTWSVFYQYNDFAYYSGTQDIMGIDPYPIIFRETQDQKMVLRHLLNVRKHMAGNNGAIALWGVPQIYHCGIYDSRTANDLAAYNEKYRYPTEHEILAMSLLQAIYGARGFIFYSYFDLKTGPDKTQYATRWPQIVRVAGELKALEPFLMSDKSSQLLAVKQLSGDVHAAKLAAPNDKFAVIISAIGPGAAAAELSVGVSGLRSRCGNTTEIRPGVYKFTGQNICGDILR